MPAWAGIALTVITAIFSIGGTWGVMSYRQGKTEQNQTDIVKDLKECVTKLQTVAIDLEVMKAATARFERQSDDQEKRLTAVEIGLANLQPRRKR